MTEEFYKRMQEATAPAIAKKQDLLLANYAMAELYRRIVLGFVGTYDYISNTFRRNLISEELRLIIGEPDDIETYKKTYEEGKKDLGAVKLKYNSDNIPEYLNNDKYNIELINEMLEKDNIIVEDKTVLDKRHISIYFDSSVILNACSNFEEELSTFQKTKNNNETNK